MSFGEDFSLSVAQKKLPTRVLNGSGRRQERVFPLCPRGYGALHPRQLRVVVYEVERQAPATAKPNEGPSAVRLTS